MNRLAAPAVPAPAVPAPSPPGRLASVDAYRGFVMFLMLAGGALHLPAVAKEMADPRWKPGPLLERAGLAPAAAWARDSFDWQGLAWHQSHVEWQGCTLHDLIQPSFMFLVGVALPFSLAGRAARGQSVARLFLHALFRSAVLIGLAVVLSSEVKTGTNWVFTNVLAQIGLGYPFLFLLGLCRPVWHWAAVTGLLVGSWVPFALAPLPPADFDWKSVGVSKAWEKEHVMGGFSAHWNKNANPAAAFDRDFLNRFPRREPFAFNPGGYATLNFVPSLATMALGLIAGTWLRWPTGTWRNVGRLAAVGVALLAAGYSLERMDLCPIVKRIWTPAWVLFSGGWCFLLLAGFHALLDTGGPRGWAFPLKVIGMNSIVAYCLPMFFRGIVTDRIDVHVGGKADFAALGAGFDQLARGGLVLLAFWLLLWWMYAKKLFVRI